MLLQTNGNIKKKIHMVQLIICSKFLVNITVNNCKVLYNVKQINLIHIEPFKQELGFLWAVTI